MCKNWFYLRVSTQTKDEEQAKRQREQTFERQRSILQRAGYELVDDNTFAERISGKTKADEREQFDLMLSKLQKGDWVIFSETSRFSRNYLSGMEMLDILVFEKEVNVKFVSNGIELYAGTKTNPYVWYTISQMLLADELQRRVIGYNTSNGLKAKKEQGVVLGKKLNATENDRAQAQHLLSATDLSCREISRQTKITLSTIARWAKELRGYKK
ncbi:MAG: recombinase family protein [Spirochaetia bacterium]|nr:recombinase family protein [Spirochaetia bacterium]